MAYVIVGLVIAVVGGIVIGKLKLEKELEPKLFGKAETLNNEHSQFPSSRDAA